MGVIILADQLWSIEVDMVLRQIFGRVSFLLPDFIDLRQR